LAAHARVFTLPTRPPARPPARRHGNVRASAGRWRERTSGRLAARLEVMWERQQVLFAGHRGHTRLLTEPQLPRRGPQLAQL
jgi:hypothetical protein